QVLVTAMEEARIKRLICVTGLGAGDSRGSGGVVFLGGLPLLLGGAFFHKGVKGTHGPPGKPLLGGGASRMFDQRAKDESLSRVCRSARLDMRFHLTGRRGGFPRQADRQRSLSA